MGSPDDICARVHGTFPHTEGKSERVFDHRAMNMKESLSHGKITDSCSIAMISDGGHAPPSPPAWQEETPS